MGAIQDTFAPLRNRNLRIYLTGQMISLIGTWMQMTAQSWVVWRLSHSPGMLGAVGMVGTLPLLLLGPTAGVWADRLDRRKILIYTQSVAAVLACVLALLVQTGTVQLWHVFVLAGMLGCVSALDMPSQQTFLGDLAGMDMIRRAVVINGMIVQVSRLLGPTMAGLVVQSVGEATAFWINGLSFLAVIASLAVVRSNQGHKPGTKTDGGRFKEVITVVMGSPRMQDLMILTGAITFFGFSNAQIMPAFVDHTLHGDAGLFGILMGASGAGAMISVLFIVPAGQRMQRIGLLVAAAVAAGGLGIAAFSFSRTPALALAAYFLTGMPFPLVLTTTNGLLQVLAPPPMRARVLTLYLMLSFGLQPIANLWVGWLGERLGAASTIRINGLMMLAVGALMLLRPGLREWAPPPVGRPAARP